MENDKSLIGNSEMSDGVGDNHPLSEDASNINLECKLIIYFNFTCNLTNSFKVLEILS